MKQIIRSFRNGSTDTSNFSNVDNFTNINQKNELEKENIINKQPLYQTNINTPHNFSLYENA